MLNSFFYNNRNSLDFGIYITKQSGADNAAKPKITTVNIAGRGDLIEDDRIDELDNDYFEDFDKKYTCFIDLKNNENLETKAHEIYAWLYGLGAEYKKLEDSYDPLYYNLAYVSGSPNIKALSRRAIGEFDITFKCKAFKRSKEGDIAITLTSAGNVVNKEGFTSKPYIKIYGNGNITLYINNRAHSFKNVEDYIEIDSELMNTYKADKLQNNKMLTTIFPRLATGINNISFTGNVTKLEITPRWITL